jgi:nickel transport protein
MKIPVLFVAMALTLHSMEAGAHGLLTDVRFQSPSVLIRTQFSEAQPVVDAMVTIFSPSASEVVWQTGRTDRAGNFAFIPDAGGDWVFIVDDQKGHAKKLTISVPADFIASPEFPAEIAAGNSGELASPRERIYQTIIGLALIFGITGIFYGVRSRQTAHDKPDQK